MQAVFPKNPLSKYLFRIIAVEQNVDNIDASKQAILPPFITFYSFLKSPKINPWQNNKKK